MKILKIHQPLSQRVWVRCRERCGNLKIGNFWIKWGGESPVLLMRWKLYFTTFKIKFLDCIRRWTKLTQYMARRKIIHSRIQYNFLNTTISCKKKLLFFEKRNSYIFCYSANKLNICFVVKGSQGIIAKTSHYRLPQDQNVFGKINRWYVIWLLHTVHTIEYIHINRCLYWTFGFVQFRPPTVVSKRFI